MKSLKAILPEISGLTGLSETALYERQRALVRNGLLPRPTKTGRDSGGAMATPGSLAVLLTAIMVTDRLSEIDARVLEFLQFRTFCYPMYCDRGTPKEDTCSITGQRTFYGALCAALRGRTSLKAGLYGVRVEIERSARVARLIGQDPDGLVTTDFSEKPSDYFGSGVSMSHVVRFEGIEHLNYTLSFDDQIGDFVPL